MATFARCQMAFVTCSPGPSLTRSCSFAFVTKTNACRLKPAYCPARAGKTIVNGGHRSKTPRMLGGFIFKRNPMPTEFWPRIVYIFKSTVKFWVSLKLRRGDCIIALLCLCFHRQVLQGMYQVYVFLVKRLDPKSSIFRPSGYEDSVFAAIERAGTLRLGGGLATSTILLHILFGLGDLIGIGDPVPGGFANRFQRVATAFFVGVTVSQGKTALIDRGSRGLGAFQTVQKRFMLNRVSDVLIAIFVGFACIEAAGVPIQSVVAFGGVGGLALGLAGKELAANLFGGLALLFTDTFAPGEFIASSRVSGRVTALRLFTTRCQDFDGRTVVVPNNLFSNEVVTNLSRITKRRFLTRYRLRYTDVQTVEGIVTNIRTELAAMPIVDKESYIRSHFVEYGPFAIECEASCFFATSSYDEFLDAKQEVLLIINKVVQAAGASFSCLAEGSVAYDEGA